MQPQENIKVLVAEDDYLVGEEIQRELRTAGFEVVADANNGREAVDLTKRLNPDVVLMDIQMPVLDGLSAAREIQRDYPTPVVILTAHESEDLVEEASHAGVGAYITKPPERNEIHRAISIAMARHRDLMTIRSLYETVQAQNDEIEQAAKDIRTLEGIIPICAKCKKIRDDTGYWSQVEIYIQNHSEATFSHSLCPKCAEDIYNDMDSDQE